MDLCPYLFFSLFIFYILSYLLSKTTDCLSGCLMSSASIQKLFCGFCSAFKCSFDEFVEEKVVPPSDSSTILELPPPPFNFDDLRQSPDFPAQVPALLTNQNIHILNKTQPIFSNYGMFYLHFNRRVVIFKRQERKINPG